MGKQRRNQWISGGGEAIQHWVQAYPGSVMVTKSLLRLNSAMDSHAERRVHEGPGLPRAPIELLIRKLESIGTLSPTERDALRRLETVRVQVSTHHDIV